MGISPTAAARTWHSKTVASKCPPTPLSGLRDLQDAENSFPGSDTSRVLAMARSQASRRLQEHQELYGGGKKEDERPAPVVPHHLPQGWAVHLSCSPITTARGRAEKPSLPCKWLTAGINSCSWSSHSSVLSSEQLFSPLCSLVWFWFVAGLWHEICIFCSLKIPVQDNMLPTVLSCLKTEELFEEQL